MGIRGLVMLALLWVLVSCETTTATREDERPRVDGSGYEDDIEITGVATPEPRAARVPISTSYVERLPNYSVVRAYFGTDRTMNVIDREIEFGSDRGLLTLGRVSVSIPLDHEPGEIENPSIWRLQFKEDPARHISILATEIFEDRQFYSSIKNDLSRNNDNTGMIFIHGYRVSFEDAAKRTAQLSYDLGFSGAAAFYSWPSRNNYKSYVVDEQNIAWSQPNIERFIIEFIANTGVEHLFLIAHSMGNRALLDAVRGLSVKIPEFKENITELILTAPDIDSEVFLRDIAPNILRMRIPATLYASSEDAALAASKKVHGYSRAGDSSEGVLVAEGIETIDASTVDTSMFGHSYYGDSASVLSDIYYLINERSRADSRFGLREKVNVHGKYWEFIR